MKATMARPPVDYSREELERMAASVPAWWHSIDLGHGVRTKGIKAGGDMSSELDSLRLPDLRHKSVLDIGANDGFYSFEAERRGARRVLAIDYYAWSLDLAKHWQYQKECKERGVMPLPDWQTANWRPGELPGKRGFDTAHKALNSDVEVMVADYMTLDPASVGVFDVVLYLGVLYHMENPLDALVHVAALTGEMAVIETAAIVVPGYEQHALCEFFETNELGGDMSNWWVPNEKALVGMCRAAGFKRVETIRGPRGRAASTRLRKAATYLLSEVPVLKKLGVAHSSMPEVQHYRAVVHAYK
jgi:tRNA (mo5U34)-methyltransferase